jgi:O-antigen ligase
MNNLDRWLILIATTPFFILFSEILSIPPGISSFLLLLVLVIPFIVMGIMKKRFQGFGNYSPIVVCIIVFVIFNILYSGDATISLQYWIAYLALWYGYYLWCIHDSRQGVKSYFKKTMTQRIGIYVGLSSIVIFALLLAFKITDLKTFNSLGIIAGSALSYSWFVQDIKKIYKWSLIAMLGLALVFSLSRSSLIFTILTIITVEFFLSNQGKGRKILITLSGIVFVLFFSDSLLNWLSEKELNSFTSFSQVQNLANDRTRLIEKFAEVYSDNLFTGYGVNFKYHELPLWNDVNNNHVHNGILEMILQVGVPLGLIAIVIYFSALKKSYLLAKNDSKYAAIFGFLTYCGIRSYGESYFLLNIGNPMSISVILVLIFISCTKYVR